MIDRIDMCGPPVFGGTSTGPEHYRKRLIGGLIASGYHSLALRFRLFIQSGILTDASMGSPGIDELRWLSPVRPGDTLHTVVDVKEVIPSKSKPDRGIVRFRYAATNQHGEEVLSFVLNHFLRRRPA